MPNRSRQIFDTQPNTWQELELLVAQAFSEMLYESSRNHELSTVRGKVKVDICAVKRSTPIPTIILCECKHWAKPVDQSVVYGFRSVCSDAGAHFGLIISKAGFQSGASETREATNIHLLDFLAFQETFFEEWRSGIFMKFAQMSDELLPLLRNCHRPMDDESLHTRLKEVDIFSKYEMIFGDSSYSSYFLGGDARFPIEIVDPRGDPRATKKIVVESYRQYFDIACQGVADARKHFGI